MMTTTRVNEATPSVRPISTNHILQVTFSDEAIVVRLADGCLLTVPLSWYPQLLHASPAERADWRLADCGRGIRWPRLGQEFSVIALLRPQQPVDAALRSKSQT